MAFAIVKEKLDEEKVAIAHKSHHRSVSAPKGLFLRTAFAEMSKCAVLHIIYIIFSRFAVTVDALRLGLNEYVLLVWAHLIAVYSVYLDAVLDVVHIEEHARLLSRSETVGDNLLAVPGNLTVSFAIQEWCHAVNASLGIYAICEVSDCQTVCFGEEYSTKECHKSYDSSHRSNWLF